MIRLGIHLSWLYMPIMFTTGYKWIYMVITCYNLVMYPLVVIQLQTLSEPLPVTNSAPGRLATIAADTGRDLQGRRDSKMGGFSGGIFGGSLKTAIFHTAMGVLFIHFIHFNRILHEINQPAGIPWWGVDDDDRGRRAGHAGRAGRGSLAAHCVRRCGSEDPWVLTLPVVFREHLQEKPWKTIVFQHWKSGFPWFSWQLGRNPRNQFWDGNILSGCQDASITRSQSTPVTGGQKKFQCLQVS